MLHFQYGFYSGNVIVDGEAEGHVAKHIGIGLVVEAILLQWPRCCFLDLEATLGYVLSSSHIRTLTPTRSSSKHDSGPAMRRETKLCYCRPNGT